MFKNKSVSAFISLLFLIASSFSANTLAAEPVVWDINSRAELLKGEARGVSVTDNGILTLAPNLARLFNTDQAYVWSTAMDAAGNIYGTALEAGLHDYGVVFELVRGSNGNWTEKVLHAFTGTSDGSATLGGVVLDAAGRASTLVGYCASGRYTSRFAGCCGGTNARRGGVASCRVAQNA